MSKKYDNNLQEIKEARTFATNTTNGLSKENGIITFTQTFVTQFYNAKEQYLIDSLLKDMQENKEKYEGLTIMPIEREKIVELLNKGKEFNELQQQLAEKDKEIEELNEKIGDLIAAGFTKGVIIADIKQQTRHQICNEAKKRIVKETCYDTEEEVRNAIYDFNAREVLEILDDIEKGE